MKYALKSKDEFITHVFDIKDDCDLNYFLDGELYLVEGWHVKDKTPLDFSFMCELSSKWDGCSHFYFNGEEYKKAEEIDAYYHLCGGYNILNFMIGIAFVTELSEMLIKQEMSDISEFYYVTDLNLLENYEIVEWYGEIL